MPERPSAGELLACARQLFDAPDNLLAQAAGTAWRRGFASGGAWMGIALQTVRRESSPRLSESPQWLGFAKYAMASAAGILFILAGVALHHPSLGLPGVVAFYAVEAQMVFLFPLALDGEERLFRESRRWTIRAGGTWAVMQVVIPLAATMIFGGFAGRGFVRSWCLGCLAVCIWYEELRSEGALGDSGGAEAIRPCPAARATAGVEAPPSRQSRFQFGAWGPLHLRHERAELGLSRPIKLLYASDLHLGWGWSNPVIAQLLDAAKSSAPDAIILGGDLADRSGGLILLQDCVTALMQVAPVYAIAGNHDRRLGVDAARTAVRAGGGVWLADALQPVSLRPDLQLCATIEGVRSSFPNRILCAHDPALFAAASSARYPLVLAGHLHGGQCVLAMRNGRLYPGAWFARWTGLRFTESGSTMFVSRGAADTLPLRWNCPREVIVCEIV